MENFLDISDFKIEDKHDKGLLWRITNHSCIN